MKLITFKSMGLVSSLAVLVSCTDQTPPAGSGATSEPYNNVLLEGSVANRSDDDVAVREILFAPGWQAPKHYHNSDLFIYVIAGEFEVHYEDGEPEIYRSGDALRMAAETVMDARNVSSTQTLKLAVFQVGQPRAPFVVPVDDAP